MGHAGIATQMLIERQLEKNKKKNNFLEIIWTWKKKSSNDIITQLKKLGISADWSRMCFTLEKNLNKSVSTAFISLYKKGIIYKDLRLINWDTEMQTAISDLEVINVEQVTKF